MSAESKLSTLVLAASQLGQVHVLDYFRACNRKTEERAKPTKGKAVNIEMENDLRTTAIYRYSELDALLLDLHEKRRSSVIVPWAEGAWRRSSSSPLRISRW
ncbi:hypothetical protein CEXT_96451 [Caerostris extrusa]|uniref:Uncharacterized protein n=1 Tax=Caerostris extrusa TaxID=172846 RepID=A0AAV4T9A4_CAEEX|nr:hypothetical protein CEXT_96451 [Caerostris extrusa]